MIVTMETAQRWLKTAVAGETLVYARATALPLYSQVPPMMRALFASGHVVLRRERRAHGDGAENFAYIARRTGRPLEAQIDASGTGSRRRVAHASGRKPQDRRTSACAVLAREIAPQVAAMLAEGAPRNACAIARTLGLYAPSPVRAALRAMELAA